MSDEVRLTGMNQTRYDEIQSDIKAELSESEINAGWHFCPDWDFMLIHKDWREYEGCCCGYEVHK